jgi:hypothetical protein
MALSYLTDINLNKNELQNAVIQKVASDPTSGLTEGWIIYNTTDDALKVYSAKQVSGSDEGWISVAGDIKSVVAGSGLTGGGDIGTITLNVVGGTGITANANDIAITDTSVTAGSYGSATAIPTFTVNAQGQLTAAGTASITTTLTIDGDSSTQDVALADDDLKIVGTTNEIETAVTKSGTDVSLQIGLPNNVTVGNNLTVSNDLVVSGDLQVTGTTTTNNVETVSTSNGVIFEGSVADANELTLLAGSLSADRTVTLPDATGTVALTTDITGRLYATSIGDGSATSYTVTHNLGTRDVIVQLYDTSSHDTVIADVVRTSTSVVTIDFSSAPSNNDIRVLVSKIG